MRQRNIAPVPRAGNDRSDALRVEFGCLKACTGNMRLDD